MPSIGSLRWKVTLAHRQDVYSGSSAVTENIEPIADIHADIRPVSLQSYIGAEQIEFGVSHSITFRWQPFANLQFFNVILRDVTLPDGTTRQETFRIRRIEELEGRHRFIRADCELEKSTR